jgi:hypothetical protein
MANKTGHIWILLVLLLLLNGCVSRKIYTTNYFQEHESTLTVIEKTYKTIYQQKHFSLAFTDRSFNYISLEIMTDTLKYIYEFNLQETRLKDSLLKFGLPVESITGLIEKMKSIKCIWINNLDYYSNNQQHSLVFMSIRHLPVHLPFTYEKYYILTFYEQPQYFDSEGQLLERRRLRKLRKINDEIFRRINDKVCYTISERFR